MNLSEILALIEFCIKEAPEVLALLSSLIKIVSPSSAGTVDNFDQQAAVIANTLLLAARSTARAAATLDFGKVSDDEQKQARFDDVVNAVKAVAAQLDIALSQGEAETYAQNGWALEFRPAASVTP